MLRSSKKRQSGPADNLRVSQNGFVEEQQQDELKISNKTIKKQSHKINGFVSKEHQGQTSVHQTISELYPIQEKIVKFGDLEFDIKMGWIPRIALQGPLPIRFCNFYIEKCDQIYKNLVYVGYRPYNSFQLHQRFYNNGQNYRFNQFQVLSDTSLSHIITKGLSNYKSENSKGQGMVNQNSSLYFDSNFEGGNLDAVYYQNGGYKLLIRPDSNTNGHCHYFNFKAKCKTIGTYKFSIVNMAKQYSLYQRGMRPYVKTKSSGTWEQKGQNVDYRINHFLSIEDKNIYELNFQFKFDERQNYVQFCYGIPFSYTDLNKFVGKIKLNKSVHVEKLGRSLSGVDIPLITITDKTSKKQQSNKYVIVVNSRIHPSQTNSSHIINGFIKALLSNTQQIMELRKKVVFKIIPMMNPDGVILGNTRTSLAGKDLNRIYSDENNSMFPEVIRHKQFCKKIRESYGEKFLFCVDIHGHSTRKNSFFYGPEYNIINENYLKCRIFPKIFGSLTEMFRFYSCKFRIQDSKRHSCRGYFNSHGIQTYTFQASMHGYFNSNQRKDQCFSLEKLEKLGEYLMMAIQSYIKVYQKQGTQMVFDETVEGQSQKQRMREQSDGKSISLKADSQSSCEDFTKEQIGLFQNIVHQNIKQFSKVGQNMFDKHLVFKDHQNQIETTNISQKINFNKNVKTIQQQFNILPKKISKHQTIFKKPLTIMDSISYQMSPQKGNGSVIRKRRSSIQIYEKSRTQKITKTTTKNTSSDFEQNLENEDKMSIFEIEKTKQSKNLLSFRQVILNQEQLPKTAQKKQQSQPIIFSSKPQRKKIFQNNFQQKKTIVLSSKLFDSRSLDKMMKNSKPQPIIFQAESNKSLKKVRQSSKTFKQGTTLLTKAIGKYPIKEEIFEMKLNLHGKSVISAKLPYIDKFC